MRKTDDLKATWPSLWLVRSWFGAVGLTTLILAGLVIDDYIRGEGISHFGPGYFLALALLMVAAIGVALLPLLIVAVVLDRRAGV